MGPTVVDALQAWADGYTASGKMEHVWGFAGARGGGGVLNVESPQEVDEIVSSSPVASFSETRVYPLQEIHEVIAHGKQAMEAMRAEMRRQSRRSRPMR
jgi:muconolactone delta-isomerase